jgi:hypothetical protein
MSTHWGQVGPPKGILALIENANSIRWGQVKLTKLALIERTNTRRTVELLRASFSRVPGSSDLSPIRTRVLTGDDQRSITITSTSTRTIGAREKGGEHRFGRSRTLPRQETNRDLRKNAQNKNKPHHDPHGDEGESADRNSGGVYRYGLPIHRPDHL